VVEVPSVVIGYKCDAAGLRTLLVATVQDGELAYMGGVELGIPEGRSVIRQLEGLARKKPVVPCSGRAHWVRPELYCLVRFHGVRPGGSWRDPVFAGWVSA
jgi:ATP-dependent DNA ligase